MEQSKGNFSGLSTGMKLLFIFLIWFTYDTVSRYFISSFSTDIEVFRNYNMSYIAYIIGGITSLLAIAGAYFIWNRSTYMKKVLYTLFSVNIVFIILMYIFTLIDPEIFKEAYTQSREMRGMSEKNMNTIITPITITVMMIINILFYSYLINFVRKQN